MLGQPIVLQDVVVISLEVSKKGTKFAVVGKTGWSINIADDGIYADLVGREGEVVSIKGMFVATGWDIRFGNPELVQSAASAYATGSTFMDDDPITKGKAKK